ncbi:MAG: glycosyltransferase [Holophagaceae bacterium]|nr:glycosyltransferase [Holophagaceae bacterium]
MPTGPRSLHVISSLRLSSGGPTVSVTRLCEALNALGAPAEIATVAAPGDEAPPRPGTPIHAFPLSGPRSLRRSPGLDRFLAAEAGRFDLIHVHGLWQWPGVSARRAALAQARPLVISPRGMLEPWALAQRAALKRLALRTWEGRNLAAARVLHATSEREAAQFRALGLHTETCVIPNGVELPDREPDPVTEAGRSVLFLSRYHPKKGGDRLIQAWAGLWADFPEWRLELVGPDAEGTRATWEALATGLGIPAAAIRFSGAIAGGAKDRLLASAGLLALPSHSENFGNVVLEALAQGVPVLASRGTPWEGLEAHRCGWWVANEVDVLRETLRSALALPDLERRAMGARGRRWAGEFSWSGVGAAMVAAYEGLLAR